MPARPLARGGGDDGTSFHPPFPGRPGLSQPCSQRCFSGLCAAAVLSRNEEDGVRRTGKMKPLFCTISSPPGPVNNLGIIWCTGYSPRAVSRWWDEARKVKTEG
jgi:hypothetical protein